MNNRLKPNYEADIKALISATEDQPFTFGAGDIALENGLPGKDAFDIYMERFEALMKQFHAIGK